MNNSYYAVTTLLKEAFEEDGIVNSITKGMLDVVDTEKHLLPPAAHIMINSVGEPNGGVVSYNVSLICMGIVDVSKESTTDRFIGNDDMDDVLNTTFGILQRVVAKLRDGEYTTVTQVDGNVNYEAFEDRFQNKWAGWVATFDLIMPNLTTIC